MGRKPTNDKFSLPITIIRVSMQLASLGVHLNTGMEYVLLHRKMLILFKAYVRHWRLLNETKLYLTAVVVSIEMLHALTGESSKEQDNEIVFCRINFRIMERLTF